MGFRDPITDIATGADVTALETITNAVKAKTDNLPAVPANEAGKVATVDSRVTGAAALEATAQTILTAANAIKAKTDGLPANPGTAIKSIQRGTITVSGATGSATATITSVDTAKSLLRLLGFRTDGATINTTFVNLVLTNGTTITLQRTDAAGTVIASYEIVEYF